MASQSEGGGKDDIKTHFVTREGTYKLMPLSEYSKPTRVPYNGQTNTPSRVSFINVNDGSPSPDRICFNVGRELYFYVYKGVKKAADLTKPIDKRLYKGTFPTCHDFNRMIISSESVRLLVGFTAGQLQLIDPIKKELGKLYNEERLIDKTKVTCIKWIPGSTNQFIVSHSSGQMYIYNEELPCGPTPPHYQPFKQGDSFSVFTCKTKSTRNPLYRWMVGHGPINEFAFSPCAQYLAVVGQDGYLRVFNYNSMELVGSMKSYFGGLLCVCWSPDSKYIVVGGEDDLVTVWSFIEKRVICRGQGHRSWIGSLQFDPYTSVFSEEESDSSDKKTGSGNHENVVNGSLQSNRNSLECPSTSSSSNITTYRFGSVGQDTMLCLWDITEDIIKQPYGRSRTSILVTPNASHTLPRCNSLPQSQKSNSVASDLSLDGNAHPVTNHTSSLSTKFATLTLADRKESQERKEHKRNFSLASRSVDKNSILRSNHVKPVDDSIKLLGTSACPRLEESPILEPLVCKRIASERLTELIFREECIVTACQEGLVYTWARPGWTCPQGYANTMQHTVVSPQVGEVYQMQF
ncbi:Dystrophia myotonica WD repeat-containing protein,WD repeat-containing protein 20 [Mytilus edulis]|uniref:Dystrophia myotonica WD repeat-containing protein,WD repeat-containing protein 20 n=1 Tax=Mytilus edulis TaxID=6550 RepID=A0A8S3TND9_MYTED|nr:Dystrophia myotonica WD repeat-containing protein,WD repeat-containing protein 20 [Mytilus edulis]